MDKEEKKPATINQDFEEAVQDMINKSNLPPNERTRQQVYATGNRWAKENFDSTHN